MRKVDDSRRKTREIRKKSEVDHHVFVRRLIGGMKVVTRLLFSVSALVGGLVRERLVA
jgi:hypothetical protein